MQKITFTNSLPNLIDESYFPKPSKNFIPEWYKKTNPYVGKAKDIVDGKLTATIKKCMPVFDAITAGYIITTYQEIHVSRIAEGPVFTPVTRSTVFEFHSRSQAELHPQVNSNTGIPKFMSPWQIETPKGYSCIFINPVHQQNKFFTIFEGIVDTDKYTAPVNFPFVMHDEKFEGIIPAGTPIAQVIPFRREEWQMRFGNAKNSERTQKRMALFDSAFYEAYKSFFWSKKSFN